MSNGRLPSLNFVRQVNPQSPVRRGGFYKPLVFDSFTIVSAVWLGYVYRGFLGGGYGSTHLLLSAGIFLIFSTLQLFFTKDFRHRFLVLFFQGIGVFVFFYDYDFRFLAVAAAFFLILPFFGEISGRRELGNAIDIKFFKAARFVLAKWTTALIIVFVILYFPQLDVRGAFISKSGFQGFYDWAGALAGSFYPSVKFDSSFGDLAKGFAEIQLKNDPAFYGLPPATKEQVLEETAEKAAENLSKTLGSPIEAGASVGDILYDFITNLLKGWRERFGELFLWGWGLVVFFVIRGFGAIFYWTASFFAFVVYQILLSSNFVRIVGETRTKEVIEW